MERRAEHTQRVLRAQSGDRRALEDLLREVQAPLFRCIRAITDFSDRTQLLIFLCACLVYAPLALGMFALRAFIDHSVQRIVTAIEVSGPARSG